MDRGRPALAAAGRGGGDVVGWRSGRLGFMEMMM